MSVTGSSSGKPKAVANTKAPPQLPPPLEKLKQYEWWDSVPPNLKTKTQLAALKLRPIGPPVAYVEWRRKQRIYYLYEMEQTRPSRAPSEAQLAALEKALVARKTCQQCKEVKSYVLYRAGEPCERCQAVNEEQGRLEDKLEAARWAASLLAKPPSSWCILDTETTGLTNPEIIQLAVVDGAGRTLLDTYVMPSPRGQARLAINPTEAGAGVHGITLARLQALQAPQWPVVFEQLKHILQGKQRVVIYNAAFDVSALEHSCSAIGRAGRYSDGVEYPRFHDDAAYRQQVLSQSLLPLTPVVAHHENAWGQPLASPSYLGGEARWDWHDLGAKCHRADDAMEKYAQFVGEWSDYYEAYHWQPLGGSHAALGDCQAVLDILHEMAAFFALAPATASAASSAGAAERVAGAVSKSAASQDES